jgi:hypothetical protein
MKLFPNLCIAIILSTTGFSAFAESQDSGFYLEGGISSLNIEYSSYSYNLGTTAVLYGGYNFNKNIAIEVMGATASSSNASTNLTFAGAFIKPKIELGDSIELFARAGVNNLTFSSTYSTSSTKTYGAYGAGLTLFFSGEKKQYLSLDYMRWASENGTTLGGTGLTYGYRF